MQGRHGAQGGTHGVEGAQTVPVLPPPLLAKIKQMEVKKTQVHGHSTQLCLTELGSERGVRLKWVLGRNAASSTCAGNSK